ncbi:hypothetical protein NDR87_12210 [Nocardia sp. CDC159]|uniref:Uncharacterized protein n=1 Tax=Nocardia pulmonis TaxID=2951408 RepID=A0A9X2IYT7_9NOCA|nr:MULTISPECIES: hypothetical protein [Nocardia]MCM6774236.1 hypothetical protein [Nocardia pulmonis]MCM6787123.1 hypothetical protein [Nocardia sp. CDC159]
MARESLEENSGLAFLGRLSRWQTVLQQLTADDPTYKEIVEQKLIAAAEALNRGIDERTVQVLGRYTDREMDEIRRAAAEFRIDDDEFDREAALHARCDFDVDDEDEDDFRGGRPPLRPV